MRRALILTAALAVPIFPAPLLATAPPNGWGNADVVKITTSDKLTLEAAFLKPTGGRAPGVILLHDANGDRSQLKEFAERLSQSGFGVLAVDLRGHGGSKAEKLDWDKLSDADKKSTWASAPRDVDAAAEWLGKQENILSTNLSIVACGSGCALAVRHASSNENLVCMGLIAPNAKDFDFDVRAGLQLVSSMPTFVAAAKDSDAERLAIEASTTKDSNVEIFVSQAKLANPLEDRKLPKKVVEWLTEKCLPKKGTPRQAQKDRFVPSRRPR